MWRRRLSAAIQEYEWTSISLSAFWRPRRNWASIACVRAARVLAAFQIGGRDTAIDSGARWRRYNTYIPYIAITEQADRVITVMAISVGVWPVSAVLATGILGVNVLTTAAVHGPTSAGAARAILKRSGQKKYIMGSPRINHRTPHTCTFTSLIVSLLVLTLYYSFLLSCFFLLSLFLSFFL